MRGVPPPSVSDLPFFRWGFGGKPAVASGPASARDAGAIAGGLKFGDRIMQYCGEIPAKQEEFLASARFIGGDGGQDEEDEVFSTPPLTQEDTQRQGQSRRGRPGEEEEEEGITMCTMPFTQTPPSASPSPASSTSSDSRERKRRKPQKIPKIRLCTRKVRAGTKIWPTSPTTPVPAPTTTAPAPAPTPITTAPAPAPTTTAPAPAPAPTPSPSPELDPLVRMVLMIPTDPPPTTGQQNKNILEFARSLGIF